MVPGWLVAAGHANADRSRRAGRDAAGVPAWPNAVAALSGKNSGDNVGIDFPTIHFDEWEHDYLRIGLMLKGGGSENCGVTYSVPSPEFAASRDIKGVRKAVLDAANKARRVLAVRRASSAWASAATARPG